MFVFEKIFVNFVNIVLLFPELIDLVPEFFIVGNRGIQFLVGLLELVLKSPYLAQKFLDRLRTLRGSAWELRILVNLLGLLQLFLFLTIDIKVDIDDFIVKLLGFVQFSLNLCQVRPLDL